VDCFVIPVYEAIHGQTRGLYELLSEEEDGEYTFYRDIAQPDGNSLFVEFCVEQLTLGEGHYVLITAVAPDKDAPYYNTLERFRFRLDAMMFDNRLAWWEIDVPTGEALFHENKVQMLGLSPGDIQYLEDYLNLLENTERDKVSNGVEKLVAGESDTEEVTYSVQLPDGSTKWLRELGAVTQYDKDLNPLTITGLTVDITAQKTAESSTQELIKEVSLLTQLLTDDIRADLELVVDGINEDIESPSSSTLYESTSAAKHALASIDSIETVLERTAAEEIEDIPTEPLSVEDSLTHEVTRFNRQYNTDLSVPAIPDNAVVEASPVLCSVLHKVLVDAASEDKCIDIDMKVETDADAVKIKFTYEQSPEPEHSTESDPDDPETPSRLDLGSQIIEAYGGAVWTDTDDERKQITLELPRAESSQEGEQTVNE
jgi:PAS domain-containing protein